METNFDKIKKLVFNCSASEADKEMFLVSCQGVVDENLGLLVDLFIESPDWIEKSIENFKEKKEAAHERNMKRWREILNEEVSMIEDEERIEQLRAGLMQA